VHFHAVIRLDSTPPKDEPEVMLSPPPEFTAELLAAAIRRAHDGEYDLEEMGRRARQYAVAEADRGVAVERYRALLAELVP
jgi:hypothetical protein